MDVMTSALSRLKWRLRASFCSDPILAKLSDNDYFWFGHNIRGKICLDLGYSYNISAVTLLVDLLIPFVMLESLASNDKEIDVGLL